MCPNHPRHVSKSEKGASQRISSFSVRHDLRATGHRDLQLLHLRGHLPRIFGLQLPGHADNQSRVQAEIRDSISGGEAPVGAVTVHELEADRRPLDAVGQLLDRRI